MRILTLVFLILPLFSFSQTQVPSIENREHYIIEADVKVSPYSFADDKLDSNSFLLAKAGFKFDLFSTLEDTSGTVKYYIVKFWEFENQAVIVDKNIEKLNQKIKKISKAEKIEALEKKKEKQPEEKTKNKLTKKIEKITNRKSKKKEKLNNKKSKLESKKQNLTSNTGTNVGYSNNGQFYGIPAKFFKKPQIVKLDNRKSIEGSSTTLSFVGAGDVQKSLNEGPSAAANTGLGVLFNQQWHDPNKLIQSFELEFTINVASTADTINAEYATDGTVSNSRDFGTYLLLPMNSGQATRFKFYSYFSPNKIGFQKNSSTRKPFYLSNVISGFSGEFVASNRVWNAKPSPLNATGMMVKVGIFHEFVPNSIRLEKNYSIKIGFSGSFRGIYGDAGFNNAETQDFRMNIIGTTARQYYGFDFDLSIRIRNIEARVSLPFLSGKGNPVPGLSDTQFVTSITFVGGFPISVGKGSK